MNEEAMYALHLPDLVVVTGCATGLGKVIAETCIRSGARVLGVDVGAADDTLASLDAYRHINGSVVDDGTWEEVQAGVDEVGESARLGYVGCAAVLVQGTASDVTVEQWRKVLDVNVIGAARGLAAVVPGMARRGGGAAVLVGSVSAQFGEQAMTAYSASKGGLRQLSRASALDYGRQGVRVNMVSPGPMLTTMFFLHADASPDPAEFRAVRERRQPLGEILDPQLVANGAMFLLSQEAGGITGVDLVVDGGLTAGYEFKEGEAA